MFGHSFHCLKGWQYSLQRSWLMTQRQVPTSKNTNNTEYMYLNGGDYFCGIYTTWTQHIDRVGWCSENNLEIVFRRYRTMRMSFRDFASVFETKAARQIPATTSISSCSTSRLIRRPCNSCSPNTCCPDVSAVVIPGKFRDGALMNIALPSS